ncbi:GntR family transcriptional regulator [Sneathiella chinensis]|uniref:Transcriptional regulator n=1 Tax=Sneathiella chinensis TaxID=349750 RepID=A0ABQ5U4I2_9PROT|nr:GntR family transcriptional regulator [Sneathiella chinensis]GLQ06153.1 transcriptional regulator [Sneathiella chinensis]
MNQTVKNRSASESHQDAAKASQDDRIYEEMFTAILEQRLSPGTKLSEDVLGEIFGVSRTVVRKVLQRLSHEKVVQIFPNRGAYVSEPSPEEARDVLDARKVLEAGIMRRVVRNCTADDLARLEKMLEEEAESIAAGERTRWVALSGDFHLALAAIAGNRALEDFLKELVSRTSLILVQYQGGGVNSCACDEHAGIIDAIRARDEDRAVTLMLDHLQNCEEQLQLDGGDEASDLYKIFSGVTGGRIVRKEG